MVTTNQRGNYYKNRTRDWFRKKGYTVELTEFTAVRFTRNGEKIFIKKDILASDGIAYNEQEFILWNSKHTIKGSIANEKSSGKKDYSKIKVPTFIKKQLIIWQPRVKEPTIIDC